VHNTDLQTTNHIKKKKKKEEALHIQEKLEEGKQMLTHKCPVRLQCQAEGDWNWRCSGRGCESKALISREEGGGRTRGGTN